MTVFEEFWEHVDKTGGPDHLRWETDEPCHGDGSPCWVWLRSRQKNKMGYGLLMIGDGSNRKSHLAHRVAWELENGPIPPGLFVMHWCDHPACVNPDHLYLGTRLDVISKTHARGHHGSRLHPESYRVPGTAKLTEEDVREIRRLHRTGMRQTELMRKYNVGSSRISSICNWRSWKHVKEEETSGD
jgi:hypothetical protein